MSSDLTIIMIDTPSLGDRSYLVHDGHVAFVVDPQRDIDRVVAQLEKHQVRLTHVFETHIHNDYLTGGLALAELTGAAYHVNAADEVAFERTPIADGETVLVSDTMKVRAIATPGHTVGHHAYAITSGGTTVVNTGDLAHHQVLLLRRPLWEFAYDTDPKQSAQTRARMLERLATDRHAVLSYHFPWPGLGHVAKEGEGYAWIPAPINLSTLG